MLPSLTQHPGIRLLAKLAEERSVPLLLVGGTVRDALLEKEVGDIDVVVPRESARRFARSAADRLKGAFVVLSEEDATYRIALDHGRKTFDVAGLRGADIEADLRLRDFTLNAMAVPVDAGFLEGKPLLIDPCKGLEDLRYQRLVPVFEGTFRDDPLRILRAFRIAGTFNLHISNPVLALLIRDMGLLKDVSAERIREEIFKILVLPDPVPLLRMALESGILTEALQPGRLEISLAPIGLLEGWLALESRLEGIAAFGQFLETPLAGERTSRALWRFSLLFQQAEQLPMTPYPEWQERFRLSKEETQWLRKLLAIPSAELSHSQVLENPVKREETLWKHGENVVILAWKGDFLAGSKGSEAIILPTLEEWFKTYKPRFEAPQWVHGNEIRELLPGIEGPQIGLVLEHIRRAHFGGQVSDKTDAIRIAEEWWKNATR